MQSILQQYITTTGLHRSIYNKGSVCAAIVQCFEKEKRLNCPAMLFTEHGFENVGDYASVCIDLDGYLNVRVINFRALANLLEYFKVALKRLTAGVREGHDGITKHSRHARR